LPTLIGLGKRPSLMNRYRDERETPSNLAASDGRRMVVSEIFLSICFFLNLKEINYDL
jgi:hypothetical protein